MINISKKILFSIIFLSGFLMWGNAQAAIYTVCSSGCDETTIQAVFDNNDLSGNDIVEVQADSEGGSKTFAETVTPGANDSGTAENPVILRARTGDTITISGSDIRNNAVNLNSVDYFTVGGSSGNGFVINNTLQSSVYAQSARTGLTVSYNTITSGTDGAGSVRAGILLAGVPSTPNSMVSPVVEYNTVDNDAQCFDDAGTDLIRVALATGAIIRNNTLTQRNTCGNAATNHQDGIQTWGVTNIQIYNNIIHLPNDTVSQQGIYIEEYNYGTDENRTNYGTGYVYNNSVFGYAGGYLFQIYARSNTGNTLPAIASFKVYNNSINSWLSTASSGGAILIRNVDIDLYNNVAANGDGVLCYSIYNSDAVTTTVNANYNYVYPPAGTASNASVVEVSTAASPARNISTWAQIIADGYELNGIGYDTSWHDPLFTSATNLLITAGSPAINAGMDLSAVFTTDLSGNIRSGWDIGAYEYVEASDIVAPASPTGLAVS